MLSGLIGGGQYLLRPAGLLHPQDVGEGDGLTLPQGRLHLLRGAVVHKVGPHEGFRDLVPRHGGHGVAHHAALSADGDIGGTGTDVHQSQIQQPQLGRDGGVEGGDGLQRQTGHLQSGFPQHGIQAVHHLAGQEGRHHVGLHLPAGVAQQTGHGIAVQEEPCHGVAHQEEPLPLVLSLLEVLLGVGHRRCLQLAQLLLTQFSGLRQLQHAMALLGAQRPAGRRHTGPLQLQTHALFQPAGHLLHHLTQRPDVIIKYVGGPLYVPPSSDPNYEPVDVKA